MLLSSNRLLTVAVVSSAFLFVESSIASVSDVVVDRGISLHAVSLSIASLHGDSHTARAARAAP